MAEITERERISRLLIVEDDHSQRRILTAIMQDEGFEVVDCSTAAEALEHLARGEVGVAVIDLRLPDLSGTQLLEELCAVNGKIQVVIHTAFGSFDSAKQAVNLGAFAYVEKGGDPAELVRHVRRAFRSQFEQYTTGLESTVARRTQALEEANETLRQEITERKRIEQALRRSEERWRCVVDTAPDFLFLIDPEGTVQYVNRAFPQRQMEDVIGTSIYNYVPPEYHERMRACFKGVLGTGDPGGYESPGPGPDDSTRWYSVRVGPFRHDGEIVGLTLIATDVTERKRAEEALTENQRFLQDIFDAIRDGISVLDCDLNIVRVNQRVEKMYAGQMPLSGRKCYEVYQKRESPCPWCPSLETLERGRPHVAVVPYPSEENPTRWIELSAFALKDADERVAGVIEYVKDITERRRAEEALRESEEKLRLIAETIQDVFWMSTPDLEEMIYVSPSYESLWGRSRESLCQSPRSFLESVHPDDRERVVVALEGHSRGAWDIEFRIIRQDASLRWIHARAFPVRDEDGKLSRMAGVATDITDRKRAEELLVIERDLGIALSSASSLIEALDLALEAAFRVRGIDCGGVYLVDDVTGCLDFLVHKGLSPRFVEGIAHLSPDSPQAQLVMEGRPFYRPCCEIPFATGLLRQENLRTMAAIPVWHEERVIAVLNLASHTHHEIPISARNALEAIAVQIGGVIARLRAEDELRQEKDFVESLVETARAIVLVLNTEGRIIRFNPYLEEISGYRLEDVQGKDWFTTFLPKRDWDRTRSVFSQAVSGIHTRGNVNPIVMRNGRECEIEWHSTTLKDAKGNVLGLLTVGQDITERKRAEEALRRTTDTLNNILTSSTEYAIAAMDRDLRIIHFNPAAERIFGRPTEQVLGRTVQEIHARRGIDPERIEQALQTVMRDGRWESDFRLEDGDGPARLVHAVVTPMRDEAGAGIGYVMFAHDITERKRAEDALRASEERFRRAAGSASDLIYEWDVATDRLDWFGDIDAALGFEPGEFPRTLEAWVRQIHPDDRTRITASAERHRTSAAPIHDEYRIQRKDGTYRYWIDRGTPQLGCDGRPRKWTGACIDITERKEAEERAQQRQAELAHVSRLSTMGEMASGIAHELNQPLGAIANYANGCLRRLHMEATDTEELAEILGRIAAQAERAGQILRRLGNFVRRREPQRSSVDINDTVQEVLRFVEAEAKYHGIAIRTDLSDSLDPVSADAVQIQQVMLNLFRNGIDAMKDGDGGEHVLSIETSATTDGGVEVAVCDTGDGLPDDALDKLFRPFFTTKPHGMGVGLPISRTIIDIHGGRLWAIPNRECGATFRFTLPSSSGDHDDGN